MLQKNIVLICLAFYSFSSFAQPNNTLHFKGETHFKSIQQLTFGGDNAEAYFSPDGKAIVFQKTSPKEGVLCDQIYYGKLPKKEKKIEYKLVSTGKGRTTCAYFMPDNKHILYASTHLSDSACPPVPDRSVIKKYVWPLYNGFDIFVADLDGAISPEEVSLTNIAAMNRDYLKANLMHSEG